MTDPLSWKAVYLNRAMAQQERTQPGWYVLGTNADGDAVTELFVSYAFDSLGNDDRAEVAHVVQRALNDTLGNQQVEAGDPDTFAP